MPKKKTPSATTRQTKSAPKSLAAPKTPAAPAKPAPATTSRIAAKRRLGTTESTPAIEVQAAVAAPYRPGSTILILLVTAALIGAILIWKHGIPTAVREYFTVQETAKTQADAVKEIAPATPESTPPLSASAQELNAMKAELERSYATIAKLQQDIKDKDNMLANETYMREKAFLKHYANVIRTHIADGTPFFWELQQVNNFAGENHPEITQLAAALKAHENGNPSIAELTTGFNDLSRDVIQEWKSSGASKGFKAKLVAMFNQLIAIRKIGLIDGDSPEAVVARAEYYLKNNKLPQVLAELGTLKGRYTETVRPWMEKATTHLEAQQLSEQLEKAIQREARADPEIAPAVTKPAANDLAIPAEAAAPAPVISVPVTP